jgi:restriction system protein
MTEATIWGIHAGRTGDADELFLKKNVVALGWHEVGDLSKIGADREAFKAAVAKTFPDKKPMAVANNAGQLYRFVHEMQVGDIVVYPSKRDRQIHIGRVESGYRYDPSYEKSYPNLRAVKWLKVVPRTQFTQGALYEIGSAMSLFQIKNYADEFRAALEGKVVSLPVSKDETVGPVADDIEEITRDYVLKTLSQELKGHPFAYFVAHLLNKMDYRTRVSPEGPDGGIDIIAHRDELGFEPPIIKVQVKCIDGKSGDPEVSALYGKIGNNEYGLFVTIGEFTNQAKTFAKSKTNLRLIDGDELVDLIFAHYEQFDSRYKSILPLKQVYVPEVHVDEEE